MPCSTVARPSVLVNVDPKAVSVGARNHERPDAQSRAISDEVVLRRKLRRKEMVAFFEKLAPTVIAIEACGASHHWARLLRSFGHEVKLIAPQLVKPYVKRGKNDAADAEALCEAMSRPTMRFVPVKTAEQQAALMLMGPREQLVASRTQLSNAIRARYSMKPALERRFLASEHERCRADDCDDDGDRC